MFVLILQAIDGQLFSLGIYLTTITKISALVQIHSGELEQTFNPFFCTAPPKIPVKAKGRSYCCLQPPHGKVQQKSQTLLEGVWLQEETYNLKEIRNYDYKSKITPPHFHRKGGKILNLVSRDMSGITVLGVIQLWYLEI